MRVYHMRLIIHLARPRKHDRKSTNGDRDLFRLRPYVLHVINTSSHVGRNACHFKYKKCTALKPFFHEYRVHVLAHGADSLFLL